MPYLANANNRLAPTGALIAGNDTILQAGRDVSFGLLEQTNSNANTGAPNNSSNVWFSLPGHSGPVLWPEQMRALADLDLECAFDAYFVER